MRKLLVGVAALCLLVPALAFASESAGGTATVVSVDFKAESITFSWLDDMHSPKQRTAKWNEKTEWTDATQTPENPKTMSADLVKSFKKGTPIFVFFRDGIFVEVRLIPPAKKP